MEDVTENKKKSTFVTFSYKSCQDLHLPIKAVSNVMHCYDDKDDFALALRVALAEVQRGS